MDGRTDRRARGGRPMRKTKTVVYRNCGKLLLDFFDGLIKIDFCFDFEYVLKTILDYGVGQNVVQNDTVLRWNDYRANFKTNLRDLRHDFALHYCTKKISKMLVITRTEIDNLASYIDFEGVYSLEKSVYSYYDLKSV